MSRFVRSTKRVELGGCRCPGTPHPDGDWIELRTVTPWGAIVDAGEAESTSEQFLIAAAATIVAWNLLDDGPDGPVPAPVTTENIKLLDVDSFIALTDALNDAVNIGTALPNARSASSRRSRRASAASQPPTTPTP